MNRRTFLKVSGAATLAVSCARVWAAPSVGDSKLLVVMLRGAYDGLSLLVPYASPFYYESRPDIAVPRPNAGDPQAAIALTPEFGLNPVVRETLLPLWRARQLAFIPFSGSQDTSRSHFQAQDLMEMGQAPGARLDYTSGYLNRLVTAVGGRGGVSFTPNLTAVFKGTAVVPNIGLAGGRPGGQGLPERQSALVSSLYEGTKLGGMVTEGMETKREVAGKLSGMAQEMAAASRGARAPGVFGRQAEAIATLMRDKPEYAIGFVDVGGWDTHVNQGPVQGQLANNLMNLAAGIDAFARGLGMAWRNAVVVVMSEFGRTFRENGDRGTDHGHGNVMWVAGGSVQGGIVGRQTALSHAALYQDRDLPVLDDYRSVLASLFTGVYGLSGSNLQRIFPGVQREGYGLV